VQRFEAVRIRKCKIEKHHINGPAAESRAGGSDAPSLNEAHGHQSRTEWAGLENEGNALGVGRVVFDEERHQWGGVQVHRSDSRQMDVGRRLTLHMVFYSPLNGGGCEE
jgi:hypothetical protein